MNPSQWEYPQLGFNGRVEKGILRVSWLGFSVEFLGSGT